MEHEPPRRADPRQADDLLAGVAVQLPAGALPPWAVEPGSIDWAALGEGTKAERAATLATLRETVFVNVFPKSPLAHGPAV